MSMKERKESGGGGGGKRKDKSQSMQDSNSRPSALHPMHVTTVKLPHIIAFTSIASLN